MNIGASFNVRTVFLCIIWTAMALIPPHSAGAASVRTADGMELQFRDADAAVTGVIVGGHPLKLNGAPGGFYVVDLVGEKRLGKMSYQSEGWPGVRIPATARQSPSGVVIQGETDDLWVRARIESRGDYLEVTGDLVNLRPNQDRAAILYFRIPVDAAGAAWGRNLGVETPVTDTERLINATYFHQAYRPAMSGLPIGSLSGAGWGLSMAQPLDEPRFFRIAYQHPYGLQMEYEFGLSPVTWKFRNRAPFRFILYRHDPAWGLRSAFERYYRFFPEQFRKIVRDGMWIDDWEGKRRRLANAADYGIVFNETGGWADEEQRSHDVLSMMYIEPWCDHIEATPDQIAAMTKDTPENHQEAKFGRGADLQTNALQLLNSVVYGPDDRILDPREAAVGGFYVEGSPTEPYYRYLTNPDPELPTPFGGMNRAQKILRYDLYTSWGRQTTEFQHEKDGVYYDSIGGSWAGSGINNFRRDQMPYVDVPLTFDHHTGRVTITHGFSAIKFLKWCTAQIHQQGRPTMGNSGPGYFLEFVASYLDMGGAGENYEAEASFDGLKQVRALMYQKPLSYLNNADLAVPAKAEATMDSLLLYDCYAGAADVDQMVRDRHLYRAYVPLFNALGAAGWQPVPYAHTDTQTSWCERFGSSNSGYFFCVRNPGAATVITLKLDQQKLGLKETHFSAIAGCRMVSSTAGAVRLAIPAAWTAVIGVNRPDAAALSAAFEKELAIYRSEKAPTPNNGAPAKP